MGGAGSGKDTMAEAICSMVPDCHQLAFADAVKSACADMINELLNKYDISHPVQESVLSETPETKKLLRPLWQWVGTDLMRDTIDRNFWIKQLETRMNGIMDLNRKIDFLYFVNRTEPSFVISDCRFANEREWAIKNGFKVVHIFGRKPLSSSNSEHRSETEHIGLKSDLSYNNSGSIDQMVGWIVDNILPLGVGQNGTQ